MTTIADYDAPGTGSPAPPRLAMARATWRQHRAAITGFAILYGVLAVVMVWAAVQGHANYAAEIRDRCVGSTQLAKCGPLLGDFPWLTSTNYPNAVGLALRIAALLAGMFLGAPLLAREFEQGTVRFAWTQGTSRTRWVIVKLTLLAVIVTAAASVLGVLAAWSVQPFAPLWGVSRWQSGQFDTTAVTLAGWTLFAFSLGTAAGAVLRRTVPAMAATGASAVALMALTSSKLDGWLLNTGPVITRDSLQQWQPFSFNTSSPADYLPGGGVAPSPAGSWTLTTWFTDRTGHRLGSGALNALDSLKAPDQQAWLAAHHDALWIAYQPGSRFWIFQFIEGGTLLVLALLLGAATIWLVRRRRA